ncbi:O-antigen ligase family protein [Novosphingobium sp. RD2P27]|uniref:O-antigen ligase family protein n=1 Tax=Novosphingobium kalidii TaxID=3230299 RepID=A0ABV2CZY3_9SPHN
MNKAMPWQTSPDTKVDRRLPFRNQLLVFSFVAFFVMVLLTPALTFSGTSEAGEGSVLRQLVYLVTLVLLMAAVRPISDPARLLVIPWPIVLALAWCALSLLWSVDVAVGARRLVLTVAVMWSVFLAVRYIPYEQTVLLVRAMLIATLIASVVAVYAFPEFGIHQSDEEVDMKLVGDWRGIIMNKNIMGAVCALTVLFFLFGGGKMPLWIRWPTIVAACVFLFFTQSKTSGIMLVGSVFIGWLYRAFPSRYRSVAVVLLFTLFTAAVVFLAIFDWRSDTLSTYFSDPTAFTGRMAIWTTLLRYAADSNYWGAGFGSFWFTADSPIFRYAANWVTRVATGHSGYIDLLITIGPVGVALVVFAVLIWPVQRLLRLPREDASEGALPMAILFFGAGHNGTETSMFDRDMLMNVFMLLAIALIVRISVARESRSTRRTLSRRRSLASADSGADEHEGLLEHLR